jgi:NADH-quinone oxidoreductase subunit L
MPVTAACFLVAAVSISGVPPFNGFFSKEMVYDAAWESGWVYYAAALLGSFFTAASFLKLGHAAFFGKRQDGAAPVKEAPVAMLVPMVLLASLCVLFGLGNRLPLEGFIQPAVGAAVMAGESFAGFPTSTLLVGLTAAVLLLAVLNHWYGVRRTGRGLGAVDHIHHAPVLSPVYAEAEKGHLDPYNIGRWVMKGVAAALWAVDRAIDWVYDTLAVKTAHGLSHAARSAHNGNVNRYLLWSLAGAAAVVVTVVVLLGGGR